MNAGPHGTQGGESWPVLETERLTLKPLTGEDAPTLHRISNEPAVRRYLWDDQPVLEAGIRDLIEQSTRMFSEEGIGLFGVRRRGDEELLGFCGFVRLAGMQEPELGYELEPEVWGMGIATEASWACLGYAFEEASLGRVIAGADRPNAASLRVLEKLGMQPAAVINPTAPEEPYFGLHREEYLASRGEATSAD